MMDANFVCDLCGFQATDREAVYTHMKDSHQIDEPCEVGSINQCDGMLILKSGDRTTVIDLSDWLRTVLGEAEMDKPAS